MNGKKILYHVQRDKILKYRKSKRFPFPSVSLLSYRFIRESMSCETNAYWYKTFRELLTTVECNRFNLNVYEPN